MKLYVAIEEDRGLGATLYGVYLTEPERTHKTDIFEAEVDGLYTAADLAAAEERGRRKGIKYVLENTVWVRKGHEYWNPNMDVYILDGERFATLLGAKEAGDDGPKATH